MKTEAKARILINDFLRRAGWRFFDNENGSANVTLETHVKMKKKTLDNLGDDFEKTARRATISSPSSESPAQFNLSSAWDSRSSFRSSRHWMP